MESITEDWGQLSLAGLLLLLVLREVFTYLKTAKNGSPQWQIARLETEISKLSVACTNLNIVLVNLTNEVKATRQEVKEARKDLEEMKRGYE